MLTKFSDQSDPQIVLKYLQHWRNSRVALHIFLAILSLSIVPIAYYIWAKKTHLATRNWFTKPFAETEATIDQIKKLPIQTESSPETNKPIISESKLDSEEKSEDTKTEAELTHQISDTFTFNRLQDQKTRKFYIGTEQGCLYVIKDAKAQKFQLKNSPIMNIDIAEISEEDVILRVILVCHKNGAMDIYNLDDLSKKTSIGSTGTWFKQDPINNKVTFDQQGNLQAHVSDGLRIIMVKEQIIDRFLHPEKYIVKQLSKERRKLTKDVQRSQYSDESSDNQTETINTSNSSL